MHFCVAHDSSRLPTRLDKGRVGGKGLLGETGILDLALGLLVVDTLEQKAGIVRSVDLLRRVAIDPVLVGDLVGELVSLCRGVQFLYQAC